ncbi:MAG: hypothetical protein ACQKBY_01255 [Verrucomicrobiales bacterium]
MKSRTRHILRSAAAVLLAALPASAVEGTFRFADGNLITGEIVRFEGDHSLTLRSESLAGEITLRTDQLLSAKLATTAPVTPGKHFAIATVNHHYEDSHQDRLRGQLQSLNDDHIILDTDYAGQLKLDRRMILGLEFHSRSPLLFSGPGELADWTFSDNKGPETWTSQGSSLVARGNTGIAREIPSEPRIHLSYSVDWKGRGTHRFLFFSDDGDSLSPNNRYELSVNNSFLRLTRYSRDIGRHETLFSQSDRQLREQESATLDLYLDRSGKNLSALFIDGRRIETWQEPAEQAGSFGDWFHFCPNQTSPLRLRQFSLRQWDGRLPESSAEEPQDQLEPGDDSAEAPEIATPGTDPLADLPGQRIELKNGDTIVGEIEKVADERLLTKTSFGPIPIPLERASRVSLDQENKHQPRMWAREVRAHFHHGGYLTFRLLSQEGDKIRVFSQVYGETDLDLKHISHLDFNIWRRDLEPQRAGNEEW